MYRSEDYLSLVYWLKKIGMNTTILMDFGLLATHTMNLPSKIVVKHVPRRNTNKFTRDHSNIQLDPSVTILFVFYRVKWE